jgi:hypothetical protein
VSHGEDIGSPRWGGVPSSKGMKLTRPERIGASQPIPSVRRLVRGSVAHRDAKRARRVLYIGVLAVLALASASVGCGGCTYYTGEPCVARVAVRTADGGADAPCQIDLVPVGRGGRFFPRPARLNRVNEYEVTVSRSLENPRGNWPRSRVVVTCAGYEAAETAPFSFHPGLVGCPAVDLVELVLTREATEDVR